MLSALSRAPAPLAFLYLSQIPYTGLDLGPIGTVVYWVVLAAFALALTYFMLFGVAPFVNRRLREFASRVLVTLNTIERVVSVPAVASAAKAPARPAAPAPITPSAALQTQEAPRSYSSYDGFKSFAHNGALSVEDIVKALSHNTPAVSAEKGSQPTLVNIEPVYEHVEPARNNEVPASETPEVPVHVRGVAAALLDGDRRAVFAALRGHVRGEGAPESFIHPLVCLLDDAYRARIDGTPCDPSVARMTARLSTPTFEKLVAALTTAIDSSYESGITGAKLALTRALGVLGA